MNEQNEQRQINYVGIPIGTGFGVALGLVLANILDHPGLFALGIAIGLTIGTAVTVFLDRRS